MEAPRLLVPLDGGGLPLMRGMDQAVYANAAGYPSSSHLGVRLAGQDRTLLAHLRRATCKAFPQNQTPDRVPRIYGVNGDALKPIPFYVSPVCREVRVGVRYVAPLADEIHCLAFSWGNASASPFRGLDGALATTLVGTGAVANSWLTNNIRVYPGQNMIGLCFWSEFGVTNNFGQVVTEDKGFIQGQLNCFAFMAWPPTYAIRLTRGVGPGVGAITGWYDVLNVRDSDTAGGMTLNVVDIWPALDMEEFWLELRGLPGSPPTIGWETLSVSYLDLRSVTIEEVPPTTLTTVT